MRNKNGIEINECCASCEFKKIDSNQGRICLKKHKGVGRKGWCEAWTISKGMQNAGNGGGKVKSLEYLKFLVQIKEREMYGDNLCGSRSPKEIYEELYGSVFINI